MLADSVLEDELVEADPAEEEEGAAPRPLGADEGEEEEAGAGDLLRLAPPDAPGNAVLDLRGERSKGERERLGSKFG